MSFKRDVCVLKWSQLPRDQWLRIQLLNPAECLPIMIRNRGTYVGYHAVWVNDFIPEKKKFTIIFPKSVFERLLVSVPPELRQPNRPVQFTFRKSGRSMFIKDWVVV